MTLLELAERCEQATGPDRELDRDILDVVFGKAVGRWWLAPDKYRFTASLDAALMLVPEGLGWTLIHHPAGYAVSKAGRVPCKAATPALALCAAALRARAAQ